METKKKEFIYHIDGKFKSAGTRTIDSKNRITIGEKITKLISTQTEADKFQIFFNEEGDILLRPMVSITITISHNKCFLSCMIIMIIL